MHPVLQSVQNGVSGANRRPPPPPSRPAGCPSPPPYPSQHALGPPANPMPASRAASARTDPPALGEGPSVNDPPTCGVASGAGIDEIRMRERDLRRRATVPGSNLFKDPRDQVPQNDYEREAMYRAGKALNVDADRVLTASDFVGPDPSFNPGVNHLRAAELKRSSDQTAFDEELRNACHQTRIRTALARGELPAGIYYLYDFVQTYVEHPDGRVALNPQLVLVAQHAGNSMLAQRLWAIAEDKNAWLRDMIEMAYMIVTDPYLDREQRLSAICTTVVELSMKYAKLAAKNGYPSMAQMAKAQEFFYRVMEAILDLGVEVGVYNNRPVRFRRKRMSELPQLTDADYMFGLTQALENRPPQSEGFDAESGDSFYSEEEDDYC
ncbi:52kDa protein [Aviadenovirus phalacrocoracidae]|uniref:52kDa protein n=1 Tax=Aviadenovirus sp. TaxID=2217649 RepID=A0ABZ0T684_9ADEN|nr:52kDa protein [Aviadenovirus sp.]